ncbi:hypothetical protein BH10ACT2_BH10ACT2_15070 [soil metagenome]
MRFGGRGRWLSGVASVLVGMLSTVALAIVFGLVAFLGDAGRISDARYPGPQTSDGCVLFSPVFDPYGSVQYERLVLARSGEERCATVAPPPGLDTWPATGEVWVSPQIVELADTDPTMKARFPHIDGVIGREGLLASNELRVIVGADPEVLADGGFAGRVDRFGGVRTDWVEDTTRMTTSVIRAFGLSFVVPSTAILIYLLIALDLRARKRETRLLQLIGTSESTSRTLLASAAVSRAGIGATAGAAAAWWWTGSNSPTFAGFRAYPGTYRLSLTGYLACVAVVVASALVGMMWAVRRLRIDSGRGRAASTHRRLGAAGASMVVIGVVATNVLRNGSLAAAFARVVVIIGAIAVTSAILGAFGRRLFTSQRPLAVIVGARLRRPTSAVVIAGVAFAGGIYLFSAASSTVQLASSRVVPLHEISPDGQVLVRLRGDGRVLASVQSAPKLVGPEDNNSYLYGTCADLRRIQGIEPSPCPPGGIYIAPSGMMPDDLPAGVVAETERGSRSDSLFGSVIWIVAPDETITLSTRSMMLVLVDADDAMPLIDSIVAADPTTHVSIGSFESIAGASEGSAGLDVLRWAGLYSAIAALVGLAVGLITITMERHSQNGYLHVLGLRPAEVATLDVMEPIGAYLISAAMLGPAAAILASSIASDRAVSGRTTVAVLAPFVVGGLIVLLVALGARALARIALRRTPMLDDNSLR